MRWLAILEYNMSGINISLTEEICGTTISLSFSISSEALMNELQDDQRQEQIAYIPVELRNLLGLAVHSEIVNLLDELRQKLRLSLFSAFVKNLNDNKG